MTRHHWLTAAAVALLCALSPTAADAQPLEDPGYAATDGLTAMQFHFDIQPNEDLLPL